MGVVTFDYAVWSARYPKLAASVSPALADMYFAEAQLYVDNTPSTFITDPVALALILNMTVAHIATLESLQQGPESSPLIGPITTATEGSVTVSTTLTAPPGSRQWWIQTQYGMAAWAAMAPWARFLYVPGPVPNMDPYGRLYGQG